MILSRDPFGFKREVKAFRDLLVSFNLDEGTETNLSTTYKHMVFLEFIYNAVPNLSYKTFLKSIIYDVLNSIISIINKRERYLQLNIRSMVEHTARIALQKIDNGGDFDITVRLQDFINLKENNRDENWNYLHQQYTQACSWLHSSSNIQLDIKATFDDLLLGDSKRSMLKQSVHLYTMSSEIIVTLFNYYEDEIKAVFIRSRGDIRYLLGKRIFDVYLEKYK